MNVDEPEHDVSANTDPGHNLDHRDGIEDDIQRLYSRFQQVAEEARRMGFSSFFVFTTYDPFSDKCGGSFGWAGDFHAVVGSVTRAQLDLLDL